MGPFTAKRESYEGRELPDIFAQARHSLPCPFQWLGREDSNPYKQIQSLPSCHWTTPQNSIISTSYGTYHYTINRQIRSIKAVLQDPPSTSLERIRTASSPTLLRVEERLHLIHEFIDVLELPVDRGKPHICHFVEVLQRRHDFFPYP
jgi:hypothetical protein